MNPLQMEPPKSSQKKQGHVLSPSQWFKQNVLTPPNTDITSLGEFLLTTLLGAMEACWIAVALIGLAGTGIFGSGLLLLPFWATFVFIIGTQWLFYFVDTTDGNARPGPLFLLLAPLPCFFT